MRTTLDIPDALYRILRARAAAEGRTVEALVLDAAAKVVSAGASRSAQRVRVPLVASKRPGRLKLDSARIYDVIGFP
jgi:plasmid stability protein